MTVHALLLHQAAHGAAALAVLWGAVGDACSRAGRPPVRFLSSLLGGWNVWMKIECHHCGSTYKVTSGRPRNPIRQWIVVRFGR